MAALSPNAYRRCLAALALAGTVVCTAAACASSSAVPAPSVRATPAPAPSPRAARAPLLDVLPATATFAWVRPGMLLTDVTSEDEASASTGAVRLMRLDVEAVLRGERWTAATADTAQFAAAIALVRRTMFEEQRRVVPGTEMRPPTCDNTRTGGRCPPTPPTRYQTVSVAVTTTEAVFIMRRRADGALRAWHVPYVDARTTGGRFAQGVIELLRAATPP